MLPALIGVLLLAGFLTYYLYSALRVAKSDTQKAVDLIFENAYYEINSRNMESALAQFAIKARMMDKRNVEDKIKADINIDMETDANLNRTSPVEKKIAEENNIYESAEGISKIEVKIRLDSLTNKEHKSIIIKREMLDSSDAYSTNNLIVVSNNNLKFSKKIQKSRLSKSPSLERNTSFQTNSLILTMNNDTLGNFNLNPAIDSVKLAFKDKLFLENLALSYVIQKIKKDSLSKMMFKDSLNYGAEVSENLTYFTKKIFPEIALSSLLLLSILASFFFLLRATYHQKLIYDEKQDFIRNMTHELKTPISTVGIALEAIQNFHSINDKEKTKAYFEIATNENNKLNSLVDKVLYVSNYYEDAIQQNETLELNSFLNEVISGFEIRAEQKNASIKTSIDSDLVSIMSNKSSLNFIIQNLVDNALKYNHNVLPLIDIKVEKLDKHVKIAVIDNGVPIPEEYREKIFNKFYRIPQGTIHDEKGHGLGLNIVYQMVKSLKGNIALKTGSFGNNFELKLPLNS